MPTVAITSGVFQYYTFGLTNLILLVLVLWDRKSTSGRNVFLPLLIFTVATQIPLFFVFDSGAWRVFAAWFGGI